MPIKEFHASTVEEFWEFLSPQRYLLNPRSRPVFRGQADAYWKLTPSILRGKSHPIHSAVIFRGQPEVSDARIFVEIATLNTFGHYCDQTGLRIPGDSAEFRANFLDPQRVMDTFIFHRKLWPSPEYYEIMAISQHHGLPTRLIDWSHRSYVAAYFAAADAIVSATHADQLAVWVLDMEVTLPRLEQLEFIRVPGANNANVAAQRGLFTLLRQEYRRGAPFSPPDNLCEYIDSSGNACLGKVTLPVSEATKVIDLCERHGINAATLFPDFYGAAKATLLQQMCWSRSHWSDGQDIWARTLPPSKEAF